MSLAWRILLVVLVLNLLTVGSVQVGAFLLQREQVDRQQDAMQERLDQHGRLVAFLQRVYTADLLADAAMMQTQTRRLLLDPALHDSFEDVVMTSGRPPYEKLILNPVGAARRDPDRFPRQEILAGMGKAELDDGIVPVAGGYCFAVRSGRDVAGFLWFRARSTPLPRTLSLWIGVLAVVVSTLLFGAVVFWTVRRNVGRPLQKIGEAAVRVGSGHYEVRLPELHGVPELDAVVGSFNSMAHKVQGHTAELEHAVQVAVDEVKRTERALVVSSRLAAVGTLAAGIAHEINNPIGGMVNAVNRLLQSPDLSEKQRTYLNLVSDGLQRVARTARKVLDFSPKNVVAQPFPLARAIDGARALVEHQLLHKGARLQVEVAADLPALFGDVHEIQQVLLNLFLNSLDAFGEHGRGRTIAVRARREGNKVHLHVDDDGPGMASEDLGRVMDPFFSKKDRPDASGLGMFICYSIVRNHGGDIELDSAPGKGFRVHITLPTAVPGAGAAPVARPST